jgi:hypothetical protein
MHLPLTVILSHTPKVDGPDCDSVILPIDTGSSPSYLAILCKVASPAGHPPTKQWKRWPGGGVRATREGREMRPRVRRARRQCPSNTMEGGLVSVHRDHRHRDQGTVPLRARVQYGLADTTSTSVRYGHVCAGCTIVHYGLTD